VVIVGFFDHMKHDWIMKFLNLYIKDPNILWLVNKYLKAGVMDEGKLVENEEGSAQGNIISPILANIYMHNVLTLWYKFVIAKESRGENFLIVYADDFIAGFQYKWEAEDIWQNRSRNAENQQGWKPSTFWDLHFTVDRQGKEPHG